MKRFSRTLYATVGFLTLGFAVSLVPPRSVQGANNPTQNVNVTNPSLNVNALQNGTWSVGITGTPNVNVGTPTVMLDAGSTVGISGSVHVGNPATSPVFVRDVDSPARNPFQVELCSGTSPFCNFIPNYFNVPTGHEFVVEYVSGKCEGPAGKVSLAFNSTAGSQLGGGIWLNDLTITDLTGIRFGQVMRIYGDPFTQIVFGANFFGGQGQGRQGCDINVAGYLVTL